MKDALRHLRLHAGVSALIVLLAVTLLSSSFGGSLFSQQRAHAATGLMPATACTSNMNCQPPNCGNGDQASSCSEPLILNSGTVQHHPVVYLVFWGPKWSDVNNPNYTVFQNIISSMQQVFRSLAGSGYNNILTSYYDSQDHVYNDTRLGATPWIDPTTPVNSQGGTQIYQYDVGVEAEKAIYDNGWAVTPDTQVIVFPQQGTSYGSDIGNACGMHFSGGFDYSPYIYLSVAHYASDVGCNFPSPGDVVGTMIAIALHEYAETVTDPAGPGCCPLQTWGWATTDPRTDPIEVADKCGGYASDANSGDPFVGSNLPWLWSQYLGYCLLMSGQDYSSPDTTAPFHGFHTVQGAILAEYQSGTVLATLGEPLAEEMPLAGGHVSYFAGQVCGGGYTIPGNTGYGGNGYTSGSAILDTPGTGAHEVQGCIYHEYMVVMQGPGGVLNFPTSDEQPISGGAVSYFYGVRCGGVATGPNNSGSAIYFSGGTGAREVQGCAYAKYQQLGATTSALGFPVSDENKLYNSSGSLVGWASYFAGVHCGGNYNGPYNSGSAIYVPASDNSASGGHEVQGCVYAAYQRVGGPTGMLGFPVSDENKLYNSSGTLIGWASYFAGQYCGSGGPYGSGSAIYVPTSNNSASGGHEVQGCIYNEYQHMGGPNEMGFPTTDEQNVYNSSGGVIGRENLFNGAGCSGTGSAILWSSPTGAHEVHGCIYHAYVNFGGAASALGLPTSDEYTNSAGQRESDFQGGNIIWWNGQAYINVNLPGCLPVGTLC